LSALPSWSAADFASPPSAVDMSTASRVAWLKTLLPLPTSLRTFVNVSSMFSPDWIASSSMPTLREIAFARLPTWIAETFAAPPVVLMTCAGQGADLLRLACLTDRGAEEVLHLVDREQAQRRSADRPDRRHGRRREHLAEAGPRSAPSLGDVAADLAVQLGAEALRRGEQRDVGGGDLHRNLLHMGYA
jgi:hypothetical protein